MQSDEAGCSRTQLNAVGTFGCSGMHLDAVGHSRTQSNAVGRSRTQSNVVRRSWMQSDAIGCSLMQSDAARSSKHLYRLNIFSRDLKIKHFRLLSFSKFKINDMYVNNELMATSFFSNSKSKKCVLLIIQC